MTKLRLGQSVIFEFALFDQQQTFQNYVSQTEYQLHLNNIKLEDMNYKIVESAAMDISEHCCDNLLIKLYKNCTQIYIVCQLKMVKNLKNIYIKIKKKELNDQYMVCLHIKNGKYKIAMMDYN